MENPSAMVVLSRFLILIGSHTPSITPSGFIRKKVLNPLVQSKWLTIESFYIREIFASISGHTQAILFYPWLLLLATKGWFWP